MDTKIKDQALRRIAIAEGHLSKVKKMVEEDSYCPAVIHQSKAVQSALKKVDGLILHGHLHSCVFNEIHGTKSKKSELIEEIADLFAKNGN